ncbi:hypothetical protein QNL75_27040 [Pseudomonas amygdali pv. morsprunorum]|uniref:hypothetical protein n=1 Tax=Pseudomonas amygdali TaxID=47877 RepID=UPI0028925117|nr:hypothetical protein [Pseudomonas amygdali]MDT3268715.1 hypothetical protein [Pseudomonas amygdali pv. morsprunorum]
MTTTTHVFYQPGHHYVWAYALKNDAGQWVDQCGTTLETLASRYPGMRVITSDQAIQRIESLSKESPMIIDETAYDDALCTLAPLGWTHDRDTSSFKMGEFTKGKMTRIYVRIGSRYFRFKGLSTLTHDECVALVRAESAYLN